MMEFQKKTQINVGFSKAQMVYLLEMCAKTVLCAGNVS